jgi:hypothetical protein
MLHFEKGSIAQGRFWNQLKIALLYNKLYVWYTHTLHVEKNYTHVYKVYNSLHLMYRKGERENCKCCCSGVRYVKRWIANLNNYVHFFLRRYLCVIHLYTCAHFLCSTVQGVTNKHFIFQRTNNQQYNF